MLSRGLEKHSRPRLSAVTPVMLPVRAHENIVDGCFYSQVTVHGRRHIGTDKSVTNIRLICDDNDQKSDVV